MVNAAAAVAAVAAVAVLMVVTAVPLAGASALRPLVQAQDRLRPIELLVDATVVTRRLYQPGDLVVVGGRLARPGWLYAMELSEDAPFIAGGDRGEGSVGSVGDSCRRNGAIVTVSRQRSWTATTLVASPLPERRSHNENQVSPERCYGDGATTTVTEACIDPANLGGRRMRDRGVAAPPEVQVPGTLCGRHPGVPREATVFLQAVGESGVARAVAARPEHPGQVIFFVLDYDRGGTRQEMDAMRVAGWCEAGRWNFELTGTLHSLTRCGVPGYPAPRAAADAVDG
jgi:hypothetical protein